MKISAIFLDRDGVINVCERGKWIDHAGDFELYPYTIEAMQLLCKAGVPIFVITNQSGVARGTLPHSQYYAITAKMLRLFEENDIHITRVYECLRPKDGSVKCSCRKPGVGMIKKALEEYPIKPGQVWVIGDCASDVEMALEARKLVDPGGETAITPILVQTGLCNDEELNRSVELTKERGANIYIDGNLLNAARRIYSSYSGSS